MMYELAVTILFFASAEPFQPPFAAEIVLIETNDRFHGSQEKCIEKGREYVGRILSGFTKKTTPEGTVRVAGALACAEIPGVRS
ncbi:MAG: hypothetical protein Q7S50_00830 [bacterium]|nr:hypothetical protein [bacterium]